MDPAVFARDVALGAQDRAAAARFQNVERALDLFAGVFAGGLDAPAREDLIGIVAVMVMMMVVMVMMLMLVFIVIVMVMALALGIVALFTVVVVMVMMFVLVFVVIIVMMVVMMLVLLFVVVIVVLMMVMMLVLVFIVIIFVMVMALALGIVALFAVVVMMVMMVAFAVGIVAFFVIVEGHRSQELLLEAHAFAHRGQDLLAGQVIPRRGDDGRLRIMLAQQGHTGLHLLLGRLLGAGEHDGAGAFDLIVVELAEVLDVHAGLEDVGDGHAAAQHHFGHLFGDAVHRADDVGELAHAGGLDKDAVGRILLQDVLQSLSEIAYQRAADAALAHLGDLDAGFLQKAAVDADLAEFIFNQNHLFSGKAVGKQFFDQCCFTGSQEAADDINRSTHSKSPLLIILAIMHSLLYNVFEKSKGFSHKLYVSEGVRPMFCPLKRAFAKRITTVFMIIALLCMPLAGCSSGGESAPDASAAEPQTASVPESQPAESSVSPAESTPLPDESSEEDLPLPEPGIRQGAGEALKHLPSLREDSPACVLTDQRGSLYQIGYTTAFYWRNPYFDLYFKVPDTVSVSDDNVGKRLHQALELPETMVVESVMWTAEQETVMILYTDQVGSPLSILAFKEYMLRMNGSPEDRVEGASPDVSFTTIAGKSMFRYAPSGTDDVYYAYEKNGLLLTVQLIGVGAVEGAEDAWMYSFRDAAAYVKASGYEEGLYTDDTYESLYLDLRFTLPLWTTWDFNGYEPTGPEYSCEIAVASLDNTLYASLETQVVNTELSAKETLELLAGNFMISYPDTKYSLEHEEASFGGQTWEMCELLLKDENNNKWIRQYYLQLKDSRMILLNVTAPEGSKDAIESLLAAFSPLGVTETLYDNRPYTPGSTLYAETEPEDEPGDSADSSQQADSETDPAAQAPEPEVLGYVHEQMGLYYEGASFPEELLREAFGAGIRSSGGDPENTPTVPDFEFLWYEDQDPALFDQEFLVIWSEELPASSRQAEQYLLLLKNRLDSLFAPGTYIYEDYYSTAFIGGNLYVSMLAARLYDDDYAKLKAYFRVQGDRAFCILGQAKSEHLLDLQLLIDRLPGSPE